MPAVAVPTAVAVVNAMPMSMAPITVMVKVWSAYTATPLYGVLEARTVNVCSISTAACVGSVPEISPVLMSMDSPVGSVPDTMEYCRSACKGSKSNTSIFITILLSCRNVPRLEAV